MQAVRIWPVLLALAATLTFRAESSVLSAEMSSSQTLLLSPRISQGETLTWAGRSRYDAHLPPSEHQQQGFGLSHTDLISCRITRKEGNHYTLARHVSVLSGDEHVILTKDLTSIVFRNGEEFKSDSKPLNDDPLCMFYSVPMYGNPPSKIAAGSSWRFTRPANFGFLPSVSGVVTVRAINAETGTLSLRVLMIQPKFKAFEINMVVFRGGVIKAQTLKDKRWAGSTLPKSVNIPDEIAIYDLRE